jgi:LPPG:FO 2-phospho-L-lactate transferase
MARALRAVVDPDALTVVVNVGDDTERYGVHVSADPDTVLYTLAGVAGPHGWGRAGDTTTVMSGLARHGFDTSFTLGDLDLSTCLARTIRMRAGEPLSSITRSLADDFGVTDVSIVPATDDVLATWVRISDGTWLEFQDYFVERGQRDEVTDVAYHGAAGAVPAPGVIDAIVGCDTLVIAPSNPPLSIWPILAIDAIDAAVVRHPRTVAVSPLFGGRPLKGPADRVMAGVGLPPGTAGILAAYAGRIDALVVDDADRADAGLGADHGVDVMAANTVLTGSDGGRSLAELILGWGR